MTYSVSSFGARILRAISQISAGKYNVHAADGSYPAAMLVKELVSGTLDGTTWFYHESPAYAFDPAEAERFDAQFEAMKKEWHPSQEEFYIHSHSVLQG